MESQLQISIPWECFLFNRIENSITFAVTIVTHKSRTLIGPLGHPPHLTPLESSARSVGSDDDIYKNRYHSEGLYFVLTILKTVQNVTERNSN